MAHRNRWFTWVYLLKMGGFSMAMLVITRGYTRIIVDLVEIWDEIEVDLSSKNSEVNSSEFQWIL